MSLVRVKVSRFRGVFPLLCFIMYYGQSSGGLHGIEPSATAMTEEGRTVILRGVAVSTFASSLMSLFSGVHGAESYVDALCQDRATERFAIQRSGPSRRSANGVSNGDAGMSSIHEWTFIVRVAL